MATRTGITAYDCSLSFTDGQVLCADDITEILNFAKAALEQGDTVVSEGPIYSEYTANTPAGPGTNYHSIAARVGFRGPYLSTVASGQAITQADFYFENSGQQNYTFICNALPGQRPSSDITYAGPYQGRITATLYDHVGGSLEIYNSQTDATPNNIETLITKNGTHGLSLPSPGQAEVWQLNVKYEIRHNGFADPVDGDFATNLYPGDGARAFSLKLYTVC